MAIIAPFLQEPRNIQAQDETFYTPPTENRPTSTPPGEQLPASFSPAFQPAGNNEPTNQTRPVDVSTSPMPTPGWIDPKGSSTTHPISYAGAYGYDPSRGTVEQPTDTVSGQLSGILSKENPYIVRARQRAAEVANSRGLLNSSMAAGAGEAAAIDAALPIAQADAGIYSTQRLTNQQAENQSRAYAAEAQNKSSQFNAGEANIFSKIGTQNDADVRLQREQGNQQRLLQAERGQIDAALSDKNTQNQAQLLQRKAEIDTKLQELQGNQALTLQTTLQNMKSLDTRFLAQLDDSAKRAIAANGNIQQLVSDTMKSIAAINSTPNLSAEQRNLGTQIVSEQAMAAFTLIESVMGIDLGDFASFFPSTLGAIENGQPLFPNGAGNPEGAGNKEPPGGAPPATNPGGNKGPGGPPTSGFGGTPGTPGPGIDYTKGDRTAVDPSRQNQPRQPAINPGPEGWRGGAPSTPMSNNPAYAGATWEGWQNSGMPLREYISSLGGNPDAA